LGVEAFVQKKFFSLESWEFRALAHAYGVKYGEGAQRYLLATYEKWRTGHTRMAGKTRRRILECVPPFLDKGDQFKILSFYMPPIIARQRNRLRLKSVQLSSLYKQYVALANAIEEADYNLDWFVKGLFTEEELDEFLQTVKYTVSDLLQRSYEAVCQDVTAVRTALAHADTAIDVKYTIGLLECRLDLDTYTMPDATRLGLARPVPRLVTQFRDEYRKMLIEHAVHQVKQDRGGEANRCLAVAEIEGAILQLGRTGPDHEYDATLEAWGKGGTVTICIRKRDYSRLRYAAIVATMKFLAVCGLAAALAAFLLALGYGFCVFYLVFPGIGLCCYCWSKMSEAWSEARKYERQRRKGSAAGRS